MTRHQRFASSPPSVHLGDRLSNRLGDESTPMNRPTEVPAGLEESEMTTQRDAVDRKRDHPHIAAHTPTSNRTRRHEPTETFKLLNTLPPLTEQKQSPTIEHEDSVNWLHRWSPSGSPESPPGRPHSVLSFCSRHPMTSRHPTTCNDSISQA